MNMKVTQKKKIEQALFLMRVVADTLPCTITKKNIMFVDTYKSLAN